MGSANLQNVMESLSNQNTISDIQTGDSLQLQSGISPLHMFMFLLLAVWGFLYVNGRQRTEASKPAQGPSSSSGGGGVGGNDGAGDGGSGGGGAGSGELY